MSRWTCRLVARARACLTMGVVLAICVLSAMSADAQLQPLPPITNETLWNAPPAMPMPASDLMHSYTTEPERIQKSTFSIDLEPADPEAQPTVPPAKKSGAKPGVFQQIAFTATEMPRGSSGLGISDLALQATFAFPCPSPD